MKLARLLAPLVLLPLMLPAADRLLKADPARSYVDVDVKVTVGSFTAHLDAYDLRATADEKKGLKTAVLTFKFADLKTGESERDRKMMEWLGTADATGKFELGLLAVTPSGQGQATGTLTFHGTSQLIEFPVNVTHDGNDYTVTGEAIVDYRRWNLKVIRRAALVKVDPEVKVRFKFAGTTVELPPPPAK